jgi:hypothetical protein
MHAIRKLCLIGMQYALGSVVDLDTLPFIFFSNDALRGSGILRIPSDADKRAKFGYGLIDPKHLMLHIESPVYFWPHMKWVLPKKNLGVHGCAPHASLGMKLETPRHETMKEVYTRAALVARLMCRTIADIRQVSASESTQLYASFCQGAWERLPGGHLVEPVYFCNRGTCTREFRDDYGGLLDHQQQPPCNKPFVCDRETCDRAFAHEKDLMRHQLVHTGEVCHPYGIVHSIIFVFVS